MRKFSEGYKMWGSVMAVFLFYAIIFILFEDYDRKYIPPFEETSDWNLLLFSIVIMLLLGFLLYYYAQRMDKRISHEQMVRQNEMRRQLTNNIAHELKTPVSSILGYTDTILNNPDMDEQTRQQFIVRTNNQAQRLAALLQDISTLNRMDYAPDMLTKERLNVSELITDIVEETAADLAAKQMTFRNCLPENICIQGNWTLIYSIFRNLTDNSINYAGHGTTIELSAQQQDSCWAFTFSDNGIGVSDEHLPRIFERFYRVDKGRSRQMGGTGLGLAIVKNAIVLHGGKIRASRVAQGGLRFDFTLKINS